MRASWQSLSRTNTDQNQVLEAVTEYDSAKYSDKRNGVFLAVITQHADPVPTALIFKGQTDVPKTISVPLSTVKPNLKGKASSPADLARASASFQEFVKAQVDCSAGSADGGSPGKPHSPVAGEEPAATEAASVSLAVTPEVLHARRRAPTSPKAP